MNNLQVEAAAAFLVAARQGRKNVPDIPVDFRPVDPESALAIQRRVTELLGATIGGWKCSLPTAARPILAAPIFAASIVRAPSRPRIVAGENARIEPEIALVLARDLPPRDAAYTAEEVRSAVGDAHVVLELIGTRYVDQSAVSFPELLADSVANQGLFVGPGIGAAIDGPLDKLAVSIHASGNALHARDGVHQDGHPLRPLAWLANFLASRGEMLRAGQIVTTGSYCGIVEVPIGVPLTVQLGKLPALSVTLDRAQ